MSRPRVLFLCTGNSARSQMAEALLRHLAGDRFVACSAGTRPQGVNPLTVRALDEAGIDSAGLESQHAGEYLGAMPIDIAITVCDNAREACPNVGDHAGGVLHWSFPDPAAATGDEESRLAAFREVRDQIRHRIEAWLGEQL